MADIEIYSTDNCPFCIKAKDLLNRKNIQYREIDVTNDHDARTALTKKANGLRTVPQIFIHGKHIGGCDDLYGLENRGELDSLLNQK